MTRLEAFKNALTIWLIISVFQLVVIVLTGNYKPTIYIMGGFTFIIGVLAFIQDAHLRRDYESENSEEDD